MQAVPAIHSSPSAATGGSSPSAKAEDDGFDFWDFLDIINPLQHIPIVSSIYRAITGDEIDPAARLIGGGLYGLGLLGGGWIGLASTAVNTAVEEATGDDIPGHLISMVFGDDEAEAAGGETALAEGGGETAEGDAADGDAGVLAAAARPAAVLVRSDPLPTTAAAPLFAGTGATQEPGNLAAGNLAAATGTVVSPEMGQALLLAAQSDDPQLAEAVNRLLPRGQSQPGRLRDMGEGMIGYSLADAPVQSAHGIVRDRASGMFAAR